MKPFAWGLAVAILAGTPAIAEVPKVVATIKPIHALVAAVMGDLGTPTLLVQGGASPHTYTLRPSDAAALQEADVVFQTGQGMELFLEDSLSTLAPRALAVDLSTAPSVYLMPIRAGGPYFEAEDHEGEGHDHEAHEEGQAPPNDAHYWLDPVNAIHMVAFIARTLSELDPDNYETYGNNASATIDGFFQLRAEVQSVMSTAPRGRFILFHDATQYFEYGFGLEAAGSITVAPDTMPGARRITELRDLIREREIECVFAEPQFNPAIATTLIEGTDARVGIVDPEGAMLAEGPELYRDLLLALANSFATCFAD